MLKSNVDAVKIKKIINGNTTDEQDLIAVEEPIEIRLGYGEITQREQKKVAVTMRTPGNDFELALGFLFTEGILQSTKQILKIQYCTENNTLEENNNIVRVELLPTVTFNLNSLQRNFYTTSSCGVCGKESIEAIKTVCSTDTTNNKLSVSSTLLCSLPEILKNKQTVFKHTGGIHACGLFDSKGNLLLLREDVGRHNAFDKLIGAALSTDSINLSDCIVLLSGRASFELIQKAAMAAIPIVCAIGAPSSLAVSTAQEFGITLVGFLKENRMNIYSNSERINQ